MQAVPKSYWMLRNHNLFAHCEEEDLQRLCIITRYKEATKGSTIYFAGDVSNRIFILKKGIVKIFHVDEEGEETIKEIMNQGDLFGELPITSGEGASNERAVAASDEVVICSFSMADFEDMLNHNPAISLRYTKMMGDRMRVLERKYHKLMFKDVRTRLVQFLEEYGHEFGLPLDNRITVKNYLTQEEIALLIGATRQTVATTMRQLEDEGLLQYGRTHMVLDMPKLSARIEEMSARRH
jgi:CRP/FNR family transcriptional regulator